MSNGPSCFFLVSMVTGCGAASPITDDDDGDAGVPPQGCWVESVMDEGYMPSAAANASGALHVAYVGGGFWEDGGRAYYATDAGGWQTEEIGFRAGANCVSLVIDQEGTPRVAFDANDALNVAERTAGAWQVETVWTISGGFVHSCSAAVDPTGSLHVAFSTDDGTEHLYHATNRSGEWSVEAMGDGVYPSIAFDTAGAMHLVYTYVGASTLFYGTDAGGSWRTEPIPLDPLVLYHGRSKLVVDRLGVPYVVAAGPRVATNLGGAWLTDAIAEEREDLWATPDAAIDDSDIVKVVYIGGSRGAVYAAGRPGSWALEQIGSGIDWPAIALFEDRVDAFYVVREYGYSEVDVRSEILHARRGPCP